MKLVKVYFYSIPIGGLFIAGAGRFVRTAQETARDLKRGDASFQPNDSIVQVPDWYADLVPGVQKAANGEVTEKEESTVDDSSKGREYKLLDRGKRRIPGWDD